MGTASLGNVLSIDIVREPQQDSTHNFVILLRETAFRTCRRRRLRCRRRLGGICGLRNSHLSFGSIFGSVWCCCAGFCSGWLFHLDICIWRRLARWLRRHPNSWKGVSAQWCFAMRNRCRNVGARCSSGTYVPRRAKARSVFHVEPRHQPCNDHSNIFYQTMTIVMTSMSLRPYRVFVLTSSFS